jgi:hypothetical protein
MRNDARYDELELQSGMVYCVCVNSRGRDCGAVRNVAGPICRDGLAQATERTPRCVNPVTPARTLLVPAKRRRKQDMLAADEVVTDESYESNKSTFAIVPTVTFLRRTS